MQTEWHWINIQSHKESQWCVKTVSVIITKVEPDFHQGHPIAQFKGVFVSSNRAFQLL